MNTKDALRATMDSSDMIVKQYVGDLSDDDMRMIPIEGMNPIALQIGHLIAAEQMFIEIIKPGTSPKLPDGFAEKHSIKEGAKDDASRYLTKEEYLRLWDAQRAASKAALDAVSEADLDKPSPERFAAFAPTWGALFNMVGVHPLMHAGQFVAVRRKVGKGIVI
jgi:hypothetical protein